MIETEMEVSIAPRPHTTIFPSNFTLIHRHQWNIWILPPWTRHLRNLYISELRGMSFFNWKLVFGSEICKRWQERVSYKVLRCSGLKSNLELRSCTTTCPWIKPKFITAVRLTIMNRLVDLAYRDALAVQNWRSVAWGFQLQPSQLWNFSINVISWILCDNDNVLHNLVVV